MKGEAGWRIQIGTRGRDADDAIVPSDPGTDEQPILGRDVLQDFAISRFQSVRRQAGGMIERLDEIGAAKRQDTKFGKQLLLMDALTERPLGKFVRVVAIGALFDHRLLLI